MVVYAANKQSGDKTAMRKDFMGASNLYRRDNAKPLERFVLIDEA
jgi:hypothetical protein